MTEYYFSFVQSIYSEAIRRSNWREALENEDERFTTFPPSDAVLKNVLERSHFQCVNDARPRVSSEDLKEFSSRLGNDVLSPPNGFRSVEVF